MIRNFLTVEKVGNEIIIKNYFNEILLRSETKIELFYNIFDLDGGGKEAILEYSGTYNGFSKILQIIYSDREDTEIHKVFLKIKSETNKKKDDIEIEINSNYIGKIYSKISSILDIKDIKFTEDVSFKYTDLILPTSDLIDHLDTVKPPLFKLPDRFEEEGWGGIYEYDERDLYIEKYGFIILEKGWITQLAEMFKGKKVLEIMCGRGALSRALKDMGVDIISTDTKQWANERNRYIDWQRPYVDIEELYSTEAIKKYNDVDYIIMSWAPYNTPDAILSYEAMKEYNPKAKMIYIGEESGGCTADDKFFERVETNLIANKYMIEANRFYRSWYGIHDNISICEDNEY